MGTIDQLRADMSYNDLARVLLDEALEGDTTHLLEFVDRLILERANAVVEVTKLRVESRYTVADFIRAYSLSEISTGYSPRECHMSHKHYQDLWNDIRSNPAFHYSDLERPHDFLGVHLSIRADDSPGIPSENPPRWPVLT